MFDKNGVMIQGHIKIFDPVTGQILQDKSNAIHYENMSEALAQSIANKGTGVIESMAFGNGATAVEVAVKMALQYWQQRGTGDCPNFRGHGHRPQVGRGSP